MKLLVGLLFAVCAGPSVNAADEPLEMVTGISRTIGYDRAFGSVHLTDPKVVLYRRIIEAGGGGATKLLLLPLALGKTDLIVHETDNVTPRSRYHIRVSNDLKVLAKIKAEERAMGLPVNDLELTMGTSFTENYPNGTGPIYLTDPKIVEYGRTTLKGKAERLIVLPRGVGRTDFTVYDPDLNIAKRYFITVKPAKK